MADLAALPEVPHQPAARPGPGPGLPPALTARAPATAWLAAAAAHLLLVAFAVRSPAPSEPPDTPLVRLTFVEPPPPPPPALGAPDGAGTTTTVPGSVLEPREPIEPELLDHRRFPRLEAKPKPKPRPRPAAKLDTAPEPGVPPGPQPQPGSAEVAPGDPAGSTGGDPGGVRGGVEGGLVGGVEGGTGAAAVPAAQVAHPPVLARRVAPTYPDEARRQEIEGLVLLEAVLDRDGHVEPEVRVVRSIPALDDAALRAVKQWRFRPARDANGNALRVLLEIPIRFVLR